jgi:hypothetical protein
MSRRARFACRSLAGVAEEANDIELLDPGAYANVIYASTGAYTLADVDIRSIPRSRGGLTKRRRTLRDIRPRFVLDAGAEMTSSTVIRAGISFGRERVRPR